MSRIHEALKKAEEERALLQPNSRVEMPPMLDTSEMPAGVAAGVGRAIPGMATGLESLMARSRQVLWHPDPKKMLFFSSEEHASGMEEFRTLRSRLYQVRE